MKPETKMQIDDIIEVAPAMSILTSPAVVTAAAFRVAQFLIKDGETDAAIYLLNNFPDDETADKEEDF